jgi:hypothetical protein
MDPCGPFFLGAAPLLALQFHIDNESVSKRQKRDTFAAMQQIAIFRQVQIMHCLGRFVGLIQRQVLFYYILVTQAPLTLIV